MRIVIGLGNPGERYRHTRHNLGFLAVEEFCRRRHFRWTGRECRSRTARGRIAGEFVLVAEPETYMNISGEAVACLLGRHGSQPEELLVVCDDAAVDLGQIRVRPSGSDGGHRGLRSIIERVGTERFPRLRIGIRTAASRSEDLAEHVLESFSDEERRIVTEQIGRAAEGILVALERGTDAAMSRFNRRQPDRPEGGSPGPA